MGTGTTAVVAKTEENIMELKKIKMLLAARERINKATKIEDNYLDTIENNKAKPRIPFGSLVELGIIKPGTSCLIQKKK